MGSRDSSHVSAITKHVAFGDLDVMIIALSSAIQEEMGKSKVRRN